MLTLAFAVVILAASCKKDTDKSGIFKGPVEQMHHGKTWTWVQLNSEGNPQRVAVAINDAALNSVPTEDNHTSGGGHTHDDNVVLQFHPKGSATLFNHVWLNWNPVGHPPANVYTKPHFDFHFYMTSPTERENYLDPVKLNADPAADYLPALHVGADPVPTMGKHWVDITSPELDPNNPLPFTQTFIYGTYDSKVVFYEPMITLEFLKTTSNFERNIPQPVKYQKSGYYPTKMKVVREGDVVNIILENFVYRTAS